MNRRTLLVGAAGAALGALLVGLAPASWLFVAPEAMAGGSEPGVRWTCPMMDYISDSPGNGKCPVCGMDLYRITAGSLNAEQRRRMDLHTTTIVEGPALITIRAYGAARYDQRGAQVVVPRIAGRVVKRHAGALHHDTKIEIGDPLVDLYSPEVFAAQGELAAAVAADDQRLVSAVRERFARWNLAEVAEAVVAGGKPVDTVTIRSPAAGLVVLPESMTDDEPALAEVGRELMADQPLITVVDQARLMVVIHVPESQARFLREGQPVMIASDDAGELPDVKAHISWLAATINLDNRAREVHLHLLDPQRRLFPGSLVDARIRAVLSQDLQPADPADESTWGRFPLVPKSAVLATGVRQVAWRLAADGADEQRFEVAPLALGPRLEDAAGDDRYVVRAGLKAGDVVATQGAFLVDSQAQLAGSPSLLFPDGAIKPAPAHQH